jgi:hypothetical protein
MRLCLTVSEYEWMIANSQRRIAQIRSMKDSPDGRTVTWLPGISREASVKGPQCVDLIVGHDVRTMQAAHEGSKKWYVQAQEQFGDPEMIPSSPLEKGEYCEGWVDSKEAMEDILENLRVQTEACKLDHKVVRRVWEDAKQRYPKEKRRLETDHDSS